MSPLSKEYAQGLMAHLAGRKVGVPVNPTETPGGLQVESKNVAGDTLRLS